MLDVVIATANPKKFRELRALLRVPGIRLRSLQDGPAVPKIRETGKTFLANAVLKARGVARASGCLAIADDSGLEIAALGGAPGVRSARFAGRHGRDGANNRKVLKLLAGLPARRRSARFRCVLVLAGPDKTLAVTQGTLAGRIATQPAGPGGFGYDPLFFIPRLGKTTAELAPSVKNRLSHRGQAARRMRQVLAELAARYRSESSKRSTLPGMSWLST